MDRTELPNIMYDDGITLLQAMNKIGIYPKLRNAYLDPKKIGACIELHIEQGSVLRNMEILVGIVTGMAGNARMELILTAHGHHTGTCPMSNRLDDVASALDEIGMAIQSLTNPTIIHPGIPSDKAHELVNEHSRYVFIAGSVTLFRNQNLTRTATNVTRIFDIRSTSEKLIDNTVCAMEGIVQQICTKRGIEYTLNYMSTEIPIEEFSRIVPKAISLAAERLKIDTLFMPSGAGHDVKVFHNNGVNVGMIFVPSIGGKSHVPEEKTDITNIVSGTEVLAETIMNLNDH